MEIIDLIPEQFNRNIKQEKSVYSGNSENNIQPVHIAMVCIIWNLMILTFVRCPDLCAHVPA